MVNYLLLHCDVSKVLWSEVFKMFEIQWVMPSTVATLLFGLGNIPWIHGILCCHAWCRRNGIVLRLRIMRDLLINCNFYWFAHCLIGLGLGVLCILLPSLSSKTLLDPLFDFFCKFLRYFVSIIVNMKCFSSTYI